MIEPCHWLDWNKPSQVVKFASCEVANLGTKYTYKNLAAIAWSVACPVLMQVGLRLTLVSCTFSPGDLSSSADILIQEEQDISYWRKNSSCKHVRVLYIPLHPTFI